MAKAKSKKPKKAKKAEKAEKAEPEKVEGKEVGKITHYFAKIGVTVVDLSGSLKVGDKIKVKGATTDFEQKVDSMQIEHEKVDKAGKGKSVGLKIKGKVRDNDKVYVIK